MIYNLEPYHGANNIQTSLQGVMYGNTHNTPWRGMYVYTNIGFEEELENIKEYAYYSFSIFKLNINLFWFC